MAKDWLKEIEKAAKKLEFSTFLLAVVLPLEMDRKLDEQGRAAAKTQIKRELGMALEKKWKKLGRRADFSEPEVLFTIDLYRNKLAVSILPLFIYGRYLKFSREIPQSKWPCKKCGGMGCGHCGGKGAMYKETVEGIAAAPLLKATGAASTKMHAVGREDIDARMLGSGRPFILELASPKRRRLDLKKMEAEINRKGSEKIEVRGLRLVEKAAVQTIKAVQPAKTYHLRVQCSRAITKEGMRKIRALAGRLLKQKTPERVLHRRADLERKRRILKLAVKQIDKKALELTITSEAGMYVKEFVTGDNGRTVPSISAALGCKCTPSELDVTDVDFELG